MKIIWDGVFNDYSSIGIISHHFTRHLLKLGHTVYVRPWEGSDSHTIPQGCTIHRGERADISIRSCDPFSALLGNHFAEDGTARFHVPLLYFDKGILPDEKVAEINNNLPYLLTVSDFTRNLLIFNGVKAKIFVVPLGYDETESQDIDIYQKEQERLVLIYAGYLGGFRKGLDLLINVFNDQFADDERVHLIIKSDCWDYAANAGNMEVVTEILDRKEWYRLLARAHYFIAPARMESFGMIGLEAASVGTSLIYPLNSAYACYGLNMPYSHMMTSGYWKIRDGGNGNELYWEVTPEEIALMIEYLCETNAQRFNPAAVQNYAREYTWSKVTRILADTLQSILEG
ncbi:MAG TPA: glycosyltransferase family 4 protein [Bacilli bacterium]